MKIILLGMAVGSMAMGVGIGISGTPIAHAKTYFATPTAYDAPYVASTTSAVNEAKALIFPLGKQSVAGFSAGRSYYYRLGDAFKNGCADYGSGQLSTSLWSFGGPEYKAPALGLQYLWTGGEHTSSGTAVINDPGSFGTFTADSYWFLMLECNTGALSANNAAGGGSYVAITPSELIYTGSPAFCLGDTPEDCNAQQSSSFTPASFAVKPGEDAPMITMRSHGITPVTLYGSASFNVRDIALATVHFAGASLGTKKKGQFFASYEDSNGDGFLDLVMHFPTENLQLKREDDTAELSGKFIDGRLFKGSAPLRVRN